MPLFRGVARDGETRNRAAMRVMEDERAYPKEKLPCDVRCIEADNKDGSQTYIEEKISRERNRLDDNYRWIRATSK